MKKIIALSLISLSFSHIAIAKEVSYDPYEGYNRWMFGVNNSIDRAVLAPVARGYRAVTPSPVRTGISNVFNNLRDILSAGSNLLRLNFSKAGSDLVRVGLNTTLGFGGIINIADATKMPNNKNGLGDTFASWGWKNSNYFVYPILGPSTVRDAVGTSISTFALPVDKAIIHDTGARWGVGALRAIDTRAQYLDLTDSLEEAALDPYAYTRDAYMAMRNKQIGLNTSSEDMDDYIPSFEDESVPNGSADANNAEEPQAPDADAPTQPLVPSNNEDAPDVSGNLEPIEAPEEASGNNSAMSYWKAPQTSQSKSKLELFSAI